MAASPSASLRPSRPSVASSAASVKQSSDAPQGAASPPSSISVDTLVNHLLASKRSLSSMTHVLRANEITNRARVLHEESTTFCAQAMFLRNQVFDQVATLTMLRTKLQETYDWGKADFKRLVRLMDEADGALEGTMNMLRNTEVNKSFRREGSGNKTLVDFVDEESVHGMRETMKKSIEELQGIHQSFDGDLLRFDTDLRNLKKALSDAPLPTTVEAGDGRAIGMSDRLDDLVDHSSSMAELLTSLTKHFDMCVTAVRTTEGAVAVARRKAAEDTQTQDAEAVSISGVIAEQESNLSDLEPKTAEDRAEMLKVVVQDATEVGEVVQEIQDRLGAVDHEALMLERQAERVRGAYATIADAYALLDGVGGRLAPYMSAGDDFLQRWDLEKDTVHAKVREMGDLREFYERYAGAYASLVLEVERRRSVDDRIRAIWRKAQDGVDKLLEADRDARQAFRDDVGEFLPTDLWDAVQGPAQRWEVVPVEDGPREDQMAVDEQQQPPQPPPEEEGDGGEVSQR